MHPAEAEDVRMAGRLVEVAVGVLVAQAVLAALVEPLTADAEVGVVVATRADAVHLDGGVAVADAGEHFGVRTDRPEAHGVYAVLALQLALQAAAKVGIAQAGRRFGVPAEVRRAAW